MVGRQGVRPRTGVCAGGWTRAAEGVPLALRCALACTHDRRTALDDRSMNLAQVCLSRRRAAAAVGPRGRLKLTLSRCGSDCRCPAGHTDAAHSVLAEANLQALYTLKRIKLKLYTPGEAEVSYVEIDARSEDALAMR